MLKDTKSLGNNKAPACESRGFVHKKRRCAFWHTFDKKCPILIDQPEDNLDNRAIYNELVKYIKKKKRERQIILVTHNPNIVVGADSEEVIVANQNGKNAPNENGIKFQYVFGSLENSKKRVNQMGQAILKCCGIREHVCDILEGGEDAFRDRENKYGFHQIWYLVNRETMFVQ